MRRSLLILSLVCITLPASAFADDEESDTEVTHYHHLTLGVDAASLAILFAGGMAEGEGGRDTAASNTLLPIGYLGMTLASPIVHAAKGHAGRGLASLGMRVGLAWGGAYLAVALNDCNSEEEWFCELDYLGYGLIGGLVVASAIDAATLTSERVPRRRTTWTPTVSATPDGARVGIVGSF